MSEKPPTGPMPVDFFNWMRQFSQPWLENMSAPPTSSDPLTVWKDLQQKNEQAWTQFMAQMIQTPEFAAGLGQQSTGMAMAREAVRKAAQAYLEAANMPTREDITRVAGLVVALDGRLDDLQERLEDDEDQANRKIETRLEEIAARLDRLDQQAALQTRVGEMETRQASLDGLHTKLDRLLGLETRLSAIEARLNTLSPAVEPKPTPNPKPMPPKPVRNRSTKPAQPPNPS